MEGAEEKGGVESAGSAWSEIGAGTRSWSSLSEMNWIGPKRKASQIGRGGRAGST